MVSRMTGNEHLNKPITASNMVSIIIPAYNEADKLKNNISSVNETMRGISESYQIIIAEDGTTDGTAIVAKELSEENRRILHLHSNKRLGKGFALKKALRVSQGELIVFMDADLATSLICLSKILEQVKNGYDITIGSRNQKGAYVRRPLLRSITSLAYNLVTKLLFRDGVSDHQCGFKAFSRTALESLVNEVESNEFFFDTEVIVKAKRKGFLIAEVPVVWEEPKGRIPKFQLFADGVRVGIELLKLRIRLWKQ